MNPLRYILPILFSTLCLIAYGQNESSAEPTVEAKIELNEKENLIEFVPAIHNQSALFLEYNYLFLVKKSDKDNNLSMNKQSGKFTLDPGESKKLSSIVVNRTQDQNIEAVLYIRDELENKLIFKDSLEILMIRNHKVDESKLMMSGFVLNDTKTKFGNEFYDEFYSLYNRLPTKYDFILNIEEMPYQAMTSVIRVKDDQTVIYEFFTNPAPDYMEMQSKIAMSKVMQYALQKESIKKELKY